MTLQNAHYTRESGVWLAVLWQALVDVTYPKPTTPQQSAARWFASDLHQIGSFEWICDALQLNSDKFRDDLQNNFDDVRDYIQRTNRRSVKC